MLLLMTRRDDKLKGKEKFLFKHICLEKKRITYPTVISPIDFPLPEIKKSILKKFLLTLIYPSRPKGKKNVYHPSYDFKKKKIKTDTYIFIYCIA
jgi:hypothetical protein